MQCVDVRVVVNTIRTNTSYMGSLVKETAIIDAIMILRMHVGIDT